ncbi:MAG: hypothetical protein V7646_431, partial [Pseudonocardia sp.]
MACARTLLLVSPYFRPHIGGVETYVEGLARAVSALPGWRAVVVSTGDGPRVERSDFAEDLTVYRLPALMRVSYTPLDPRWPGQLRRIIRAERPDFVNVHTPVPGLADVATLAAGQIPTVVTYHAASLRKPGRAGFNLVASAYGVLEASMMRRAKLVLGVSDYVADALRVRHGEKVGVLENAVDATAVREFEPAAPRKHDVAFVARLDPTHAWKGLDQLLEAVGVYTARFDDSLRVLVLGDGADRARYEAGAEKLGIAENVEFAGTVTGEEKFTALRGCRVLVACPTSANDAFPTVMLEAWASGLPVIATAMGPLSSLVEDGVTGLLVPPLQPAALAEGMHRVL